MKTYISGQITGLELSEAQAKFYSAEQHLLSQGYNPVNPMKVCPFNPEYKWEDYMIEDIKALFDCEAIYMLHGWHQSKGARIEHHIAKELGMHIIYQ